MRSRSAAAMTAGAGSAPPRLVAGGLRPWCRTMQWIYGLRRNSVPESRCRALLCRSLSVISLDLKVIVGLRRRSERSRFSGGVKGSSRSSDASHSCGNMQPRQTALPRSSCMDTSVRESHCMDPELRRKQSLDSPGSRNTNSGFNLPAGFSSPQTSFSRAVHQTCIRSTIQDLHHLTPRLPW